MSELWFAWDSDEGLLCIGDYETVLDAYQKAKQCWRDAVDDYGEFCGDERVIMGRVEHEFVARPTGQVDEDGNEYWSFFEDEKRVE
ncbi:MAG: hypothetical protein K6T83_08160 [Alicyclobacillus sp.]|nr:hypothetical protein [Alicyclobacillus sp.]